MQLVQINFDDAFLYQDNFIQELINNDAGFINFNNEELNFIREIRLFASTKKVTRLIQLITQKIEEYNFTQPLITFYGSGDFHHLTLALLKLAANHTNKPFTVIHIDNHPDWCKDPVISCGSWVNEALKYSFINKVITLGICSNDLKLPEIKRANLQALQNEKLVVLPSFSKPSFVFKNYNNCASFNYQNHRLYWNNINSFSANSIINLINKHVTTDYVYITIDKDVLTTNNQITNWDQGKMELSTLIELLKILINNKKVVGIDILGDYSTPMYSGFLPIKLYKKFEILMDQPKITDNISSIAKFNEQTNLQLLKIIQN